MKDEFYGLCFLLKPDGPDKNLWLVRRWELLKIIIMNSRVVYEFKRS